jgi:hypothetical protein
MATTNARVIALMSAIVVAVLASQAQAAQISPERAAALQRCNTQADQRYHDYVDNGGYGRERSEWYQACMAEAGQEP